MDGSILMWAARRETGLSQSRVAHLAGTSQATLSAYERGAKSPSLKVVSRILRMMGFELVLRSHIDWVEHHPQGIVAFWAPSSLWRVETPMCFDILEMPDQIHGTEKNEWDLRDRDERRGAYEQLIRRGLPQQMIRWLDGGFLIDLWDELDLPDPVREAWQPAIGLATRTERIFALEFVTDRKSDSFVADTARIRRYEPLPPPPPPPPPPRSRFDPRPPANR